MIHMSFETDKMRQNYGQKYRDRDTRTDRQRQRIEEQQLVAVRQTEREKDR